jgi:hypothetical protein
LCCGALHLYFISIAIFYKYYRAVVAFLLWLYSRFGEAEIRFSPVGTGEKNLIFSGLTTPASSKGKRSIIFFLDFSHPSFMQLSIPRQHLLKEGKFCTGIVYTVLKLVSAN